MRHKFNVGDKVFYTNKEYTIFEIKIFNFTEPRYSISDGHFMVIGIKEDELELVEWK